MAHIDSSAEQIDDSHKPRIPTPPTTGMQKIFTYIRSSGHMINTPLLCGGIVLIALALNLYKLGAPSLWFDETFSVELARQPLPVLWHIIFGPEPNMELYYLLLHGWLSVATALGAHPVEWIVRLPSALCAALSTAVVFLLGRRYLGRGAGSVAALLYALNYLQLIYAQQARAYALQLFLICLSWLALLILCTPTRTAATERSTPRRQQRWWLLVYILTTTLAIYAHLFSFLIVGAQVVAYGGLCLVANSWRTSARRQWKSLALSLVLVALLSIPMVLVSRQGAKTGWLPVPHLAELQALFVIVSGSNPRYLLVMIGAILLGLLLLGLAYGQRLVGKITPRRMGIFPWLGRRTGTGNVKPSAPVATDYLPLAWTLLCWFLIPIVVSYVVSQGSLRLFSTRYLVVVVPPFCLLATLSIALLRRLPLRVLLALLLLGCAALVTPHYYQNAQVEDWRSAVQWLQIRYQPGDGLVCYDNEMNQGCQTAIEYYLQAYPTAAHFTADTPGLFSWQQFGPAQPQSSLLAALDTQALTTFANHHPHLIMVIGRVPDAQGAAHAQQTVQWLNQHYHLTAHYQSATVTVWYYTTH
jgi:4-amino-4-deoxy-L-arabinose transferase and related glycosyltransferases of PMT family